MAWFAIVFGTDTASNASRKTAIAWGAAKHYYTYHTCTVSTINPNTMANHAVAN